MSIPKNKIIEMKLDTIHFNNIRDKKKIYECRLLDNKRQQINLRDEILFIDRGSNKTLQLTVTE